MQVTQFIKGLNNDLFGEWKRLREINRTSAGASYAGPATMIEAYSQANDYLNLIDTRRDRSAALSATVYNAFIYRCNQAKGVDYQEQGKSAPRSRQKKGAKRNPNHGKECDYCGKMNHIEKECYKKKRDLESSEDAPKTSSGQDRKSDKKPSGNKAPNKQKKKVLKAQH